MSFYKIENLSGLSVVSVETPHASATISLTGAQVLSFVPKHDHRERLWLSPQAILDGSKPIRGGIPVCWPWFGARPDDIDGLEADTSSHGVARTAQWQLSAQHQADNGTVSLTFTPENAFETPLVPTIHISIRQALRITLTTLNSANTASTFYAALHTYFRVEDIHKTALRGIEQPYFDKLTGTNSNQAPSPYIITAETDRVHHGGASRIALFHGTSDTLIESFGGDSTVVWNPWIRGSQALGDMPDDGYRTLLCVETARTQHGVIGAGDEHQLTQVIT
ncbi:D-hexose-6-phosphate mutarotase [Alteromonas oceanisediminis]|uniref:D-hexose-6-phosphate mutarotase n=1 Tax=Alteromonas oceanisediminis TaxID=2836180 RepID=UPI001BD97FF4|nr:D-hexose-6-phosphate mutarotase [Alteromonas oceanisediminis]MBT0586557.1 D-hexose-6-phosphate mutarotase [Alteromonas oceanisediminis]